MARISSDSVNAVRDAADMAEVVGQYTDLKRAGGQMMGLCPFHDERSPSFSVDPPTSSTTASAAGWQGTSSAS